MHDFIILFAFMSNFYDILVPRKIPLNLSCRFKVVKLAHFAIPFSKYFAPLSPIVFQLRFRSKEVRVTHFSIPSPKYFAPFSPILFH